MNSEVEMIEDRLFLSQTNRYKYCSDHSAAAWVNVQNVPYVLTGPSFSDRKKIRKDSVDIESRGFYYGDYGMVREINNYSTNYWIPRHVVKSYGLKVRRGQKPHLVTNMTFNDPRDPDNIYGYRTVYLYNLDQLQSIDCIRGMRKVRTYNNVSVEDRVIDWLKINRVNVKHQSNVARFEYFDGKKYYIAMPNIQQFKNANEYYSVLMHEVGHYIRFKRFRRFRDGNFPKFGSEKYAYEELIAELTGAIICRKMGIETDTNKHLSYLFEWLMAFKPKVRHPMFKLAAKDAEKIVASLKFVGV